MSASRSRSRKVRPWAFLTPDLLLDVSGRLHDAADFVRFHAVCTSWRDLDSPATRPKFLPWILNQSYGHIRHSPMSYSSKGTSRYHHGCNDILVLSASRAYSAGNCVASADGTAAWRFVRRPSPRLVDLVTRTAKPLPRFPVHNGVERHMRNPQGIVYGDGTVFLYTCRDSIYMAAILRPGDAAWTVMQKSLVRLDRRPSAAYHDGKVLLSPDLYSWSVLALDFRADGKHDTTASEGKSSRDKPEEWPYTRYHCYVLESHGELLRASVIVNNRYYRRYDENDLARAVSVKVHALEKASGNEMRWVVRHGSTLADRVLYLGFQASFSADAAQLGICGGYAYFVFADRVFRCSLVVHGEAELIEKLSPTHGEDKIQMWLRPQPVIAPIQKIRERLEIQGQQNLENITI